MAHQAPSRFQRFVLPGLAFKAVVIGGGYATGRELIEFFMPAGPLGGVVGMLLAMGIWSGVCAVAFALAHKLGAYEYHAFFKALLGPLWPAFECFYLLFLVLILAVIAAAAGEIGAALFDWPLLAGTLALMILVAGVTSLGSAAVERMFRFTSIFLYIVYALFLVFAVTRFGDRIAGQFSSDQPRTGWAVGGLTYASYNVVAAVTVLPFIRHLTRRRDAVVAGVLAGPLAMIPAFIFFVCMTSFYPAISDEALPSDFLLRRLGAPWFQILFQLMIFCALLETGVGAINVLHERIGASSKRYNGARYSWLSRLLIGSILLTGSGFVAVRFGLVTLIAQGYGAFGFIMLGVFVVPLLTIGLWRLNKRPSHPLPIREEFS